MVLIFIKLKKYDDLGFGEYRSKNKGNHLRISRDVFIDRIKTHLTYISKTIKATSSAPSFVDQFKSVEESFLTFKTNFQNFIDPNFPKSVQKIGVKKQRIKKKGIKKKNLQKIFFTRDTDKMKILKENLEYIQQYINEVASSDLFPLDLPEKSRMDFVHDPDINIEVLHYAENIRTRDIIEIAWLRNFLSASGDFEILVEKCNLTHSFKIPTFRVGSKNINDKEWLSRFKADLYLSLLGNYREERNKLTEEGLLIKRDIAKYLKGPDVDLSRVFSIVFGNQSKVDRI
jgi:hypothetical protein